MKKLMMSASLLLALQDTAFALPVKAPALDKGAAATYLSIAAASAELQTLAPYLDDAASAAGQDGLALAAPDEAIPLTFQGASALMAPATQAIKFKYSHLPETNALSMLLLGLALVGLTVRRNKQDEKFS
jgi:hypothetical protein